jgi:hypothetical protein
MGRKGRGLSSHRRILMAKHAPKNNDKTSRFRGKGMGKDRYPSGLNPQRTRTNGSQGSIR